MLQRGSRNVSYLTQYSVSLLIFGPAHSLQLEVIIACETIVVYLPVNFLESAPFISRIDSETAVLVLFTFRTIYKFTIVSVSIMNCFLKYNIALFFGENTS